MSHRWYVINVHSGSEKKVAEAIREKVEKQAFSDKIVEVLVPTHEVMEMRRGKKTMAEKKFFPGYVLVKMELTEDAWYLIKNTAKVSGFLGGRGKPAPISEVEVARLLSQVEQGTGGQMASQRMFEIGEQVRVSDGPFASFNGLVEEIDQEKSRLKVSVSIFGRSTPVDLEFDQVEKI
ncbi:MAG: transcription termination/antitermination factor NusG [Alphaproteobacteria bacterium RIFCSPHIGHO2_01_FULL_41_14]|nr:MAG: transcription termination/antitermination factor NusG [Alphaproteobacteria bacterium GWB1_45_5]OFW76485.1 MAG: transcription termination/antitermination factor NusG [Alphaproteobacteria bacterium GWA1_45_9]OFW89263.1 MAG: transcription termination/antitermination factor NusG [Alphaproteobacteria bacterium RIFCSPHIGHO2_01_FULL_41_14]